MVLQTQIPETKTNHLRSLSLISQFPVHTGDST